MGSDAVLYVWYKDPQAPSPRIGMGLVINERNGMERRCHTLERRDEWKGVSNTKGEGRPMSGVGRGSRDPQMDGTTRPTVRLRGEGV